MRTISRRTGTIVGAFATLAVVCATAMGGDYAGDTFAVRIDSPTVKVGTRAEIVARISPLNGFRIADAYRHRLVRLSATDDGVQLERKVVRGSMSDGTVVFRIDVVPKTPGPHLVTGVFRFSVTNGERLDIKAAPFEATVTATD